MRTRVSFYLDYYSGGGWIRALSSKSDTPEAARLFKAGFNHSPGKVLEKRIVKVITIEEVIH